MVSMLNSVAISATFKCLNNNVKTVLHPLLICLVHFFNVLKQNSGQIEHIAPLKGTTTYAQSASV